MNKHWDFFFLIKGHEAESAYLVTSKDEVFAVGVNVLGRLGIGDVISTQQPIKLDELCGKHVICKVFNI